VLVKRPRGVAFRDLKKQQYNAREESTFQPVIDRPQAGTPYCLRKFNVNFRWRHQDDHGPTNRTVIKTGDAITGKSSGPLWVWLRNTPKRYAEHLVRVDPKAINPENLGTDLHLLKQTFHSLSDD